MSAETRSYLLTTRLVAAGRGPAGWRPARWVAELRREGWTSAELVARGEGDSEREAVDGAMVALRG